MAYTQIMVRAYAEGPEGPYAGDIVIHRDEKGDWWVDGSLRPGARVCINDAIRILKSLQELHP
jgi:hypothetical protein